METCKICNNTYETTRLLLNHIKKDHLLNTQQYYDRYIKTITEGICKICKKPTTFISFSYGYHIYCSHSCNNKSDLHKNNVAKTKLIRYGNTSYNNSEKMKNTFLNMSQEKKTTTN